MKDLKTIESRVRVILSNHKEARDDDMILYLLYCNRYESIRRTRQKIQAVTPELGCSPKVRRARKKQQGNFKAYATDKKK